MGFNVTFQSLEEGECIEESTFTSPGYSGVWEAVKGEIDRTGQLPSGFEGWNEGSCVGSEHDCESDPARCIEATKESIREWIRSSLEDFTTTTMGFSWGHAGPRFKPTWSSI